MQLPGDRPQRPDARASDADREQVAEALRRHLVEGRLTTDELSERMETVFAARTHGELVRVTDDLPDLPPPADEARRRRRVSALRNAGFRAHLTAYAVVNSSLVGVWALGDGGDFWPVWPAWGWGIGVAFHAVGVRAAQRASRAAARRRERRALSSDHRPRGSLPPPDEAHGRRWVAAAFVDVVASTTFVELRGEDAWIVARRRLREVIEAAVGSHGGRIAGSEGDGFLLRLPSPDAAVRAGLAVQRALVGDPDGLQVRIGIHAGEVVVEADDDLIGRVVNLASRVTAAAEPGEILVTEIVADQAPPHVVLADRGLRELRGFAQPRHLLAVEPAD